MKEIPRELLLELVEAWKRGNLSENQVHERAEALWGQHEWPELDESDPGSIAIEVLSQLELLNHQLITTDDVAAIVDFLSTPKGREKDAWKAWRRYWDSINVEARKRELKNHPYYVT